MILKLLQNRHILKQDTVVTESISGLKEYNLTASDSQSIVIPHGADINFSLTNTFTYSILCKWPASMVGQFVVLANKRAATGNGWVLFKDNTEKLFFQSISNYSYQGHTVMSAGEWHLIQVSWAGQITSTTANKFYVDGKVQTITRTGANSSANPQNTADLRIGTRLNSPIYADLAVALFSIHNVALDVNQIPNLFWRDGRIADPKSLPGCVRCYRFLTDTFSTNYAVIDEASGLNGVTSNMNGDERITANSLSVQSPTGVVATPRSTVRNTIYWNNKFATLWKLEVSDNGTDGWTTLIAETSQSYFHHNIGAANTTKYYRVTAMGNGTTSAPSSVVSATTLSLSYADVHYQSTKGLGDNSYNFGLSVETLRVAPCGYYDATSNTTYFAHMTRAEVGYDMVPYVYSYNHTTEVWSESYYVGLKDRSGLDRHPMPAIMVGNDGSVLVIATHFHNEPLQIWRSNSAYDISLFTKVTEVGVRCDYPEIRKMTNGDIYVFCRHYDAGYTTAGYGYFKSTTNGATWNSLVNILQYTYSVGRPYPTMPPQPNTIDRIHINIDIRNDSGGPFPSNPDKVGYWKDMGYMYSDDGLTWYNGAGTFSKQVVSSGFITEAQWTTNYQYLDSVGTVDAGMGVSVVTPAGKFYVSHYKDNGTYNVLYHNGTSWISQVLTFPDVAPDFFAFAYQGIQIIRHISGDTFDIYATKSGVVKRYRTTDRFATLTLAETPVLPNVNGAPYERGTHTHNIYETPEPFLFYSLKVTQPVVETDPGVWSDIVLKRI
jgi:hypothetical protein